MGTVCPYLNLNGVGATEDERAYVAKFLDCKPILIAMNETNMKNQATAYRRMEEWSQFGNTGCTTLCEVLYSKKKMKADMFHFLGEDQIVRIIIRQLAQPGRVEIILLDKSGKQLLTTKFHIVIGATTLAQRALDLFNYSETNPWKRTKRFARVIYSVEME